MKSRAAQRLAAAMRLNAELTEKLAALEEELRWRPVDAWPGRGFREPADSQNEYEVSTSTSGRTIVHGSIGRAGMRLINATHFRPVVGSDPEPLSSAGKIWRPMTEAPRDATWIRALLADGRILRAHFAEDLSGEAQPAFSGWFTDSGSSFILIEPVSWMAESGGEEGS